MSRVKIMGGPIKEPPKPVGKAEIQGQGSIPYAKIVNEKTPNTAKGIKTMGTSRGMGAMLRGGKFSSC